MISSTKTQKKKKIDGAIFPQHITDGYAMCLPHSLTPPKPKPPSLSSSKCWKSDVENTHKL